MAWGLGSTVPTLCGDATTVHAPPGRHPVRGHSSQRRRQFCPRSRGQRAHFPRAGREQVTLMESCMCSPSKPGLLGGIKRRSPLVRRHVAGLDPTPRRSPFRAAPPGISVWVLPAFVGQHPVRSVAAGCGFERPLGRAGRGLRVRYQRSAGSPCGGASARLFSRLFGCPVAVLGQSRSQSRGPGVGATSIDWLFLVWGDT